LIYQAGTLSQSLEFHKRSELVISVNDETLSVVAMRVGNPNRSVMNLEVKSD